MKNLAKLLIAWALLTSVGYAQTQIKELWIIDSGLNSPESVVVDAMTDTVYVANMAGGPTDKNGQGYIFKASLDGKVIQTQWVSGLNSPKGMGIYDGKLWVAAIDEVVVIQIGGINDGQVVARIKVPEAQCLNGLDIDADGTVFVADVFANTIFSIKEGLVNTVVKSAELQSPNGILVKPDQILVASTDLHVAGIVDFERSAKKGGVVAIDRKTLAIRAVSSTGIGMLDGLNLLSDDQYLVSDWAASKLYTVSTKGDIQELAAIPGNIADFGFAPTKRLLVVPLMNANTLRAYRVE